MGKVIVIEHLTLDGWPKQDRSLGSSPSAFELVDSATTRTSVLIATYRPVSPDDR